jgi:hypothetical protein
MSTKPPLTDMRELVAREASVIHPKATGRYKNVLPGWWQEEELHHGEAKHIGA